MSGGFTWPEIIFSFFIYSKLFCVYECTGKKLITSNGPKCSEQYLSTKNINLDYYYFK